MRFNNKSSTHLHFIRLPFDSMKLNDPKTSSILHQKLTFHSSIAEKQAVQNPLPVLHTKLKECETRYRNWVANTSLPAEAALVTVTAAIPNATICLLVGTLSDYVLTTLSASPLRVASPLQPLKVQLISGERVAHSCNVGIMMGFDMGITSVMKRIRGKEDAQTCMVAGFGAGVMVSLLRGRGLPYAFSYGVLHGLMNVGMFKAKEKFLNLPGEKVQYKKTRDMLRSLGLNRYFRNFKRGFLTDETLSLLTDSDLKEVKIAPGARLLILNHIKREKKGEDIAI